MSGPHRWLRPTDAPWRSNHEGGEWWKRSPAPVPERLPAARRVLVIACNDPLAESGLGTRLRTTIEALSRAAEVDVVAVGGSPLEDAPPSLRQSLGDEVREYRTVNRAPLRATPLRYLRWLTSTLPRELFFADYERERHALERHLTGPYDLVWCGSPRAYLVFGSIPRRRLVTDLSQYEADRDLDLLRAAPTPHGVGASVRHLLRSLVARLDRMRWRRLYRRICADSDLTTICSGADRERVGRSSIEVVPNSYPAPEQPSGVGDGSPTMLLAGFFPYRPNADAARALVREILPRVRKSVPDAQVRLVGRTTADVERLADVPGVTVTGFVPRIADELARARVVAVPMSVVAGTNMKIIEALAYRVPVVASTSAANGLDLLDGRDVLIREDAAQFADACIRLLEDRSYAAAIADGGYDAYVSRFRSDAVAQRIAALAWSVCSTKTDKH